MIENLGLTDLLDQTEKGAGPLLKADPAIYGHVKTNLEVIVGEAELTISELLQLKPGSVFKMLEEVNAPMKLRMDGKIIAIGSLVIVDDCFGFEVAEIIS